MQPSLRNCLLLALLVLTSCSDDREPGQSGASAPASGAAPFTQAEFEAFKAEGPEQAARKMAPYDYWLHYRLMEASGMVDALGGEDRAVTALKALGIAYEERAKVFAKDDVPKLVPASFDGTGVDAGFAGLGMGGFAGLIGGSMMSGVASQVSDEQLRDIASRGPIKFDGANGSAKLQIGEDGSIDQTMEFPVEEVEGIDGKVKVTMKMKACPDPQGKVDIDLEIESRMNVSGQPGTGGAIKSTLHYSRYLDDDAHLISGDGAGESDLNIDISSTGKGGDKHVNVSQRWGRDGTGSSHSNAESGYSFFRPEEVRHTQEMLDSVSQYMSMIAEMMLRGAGSQAPWESGHCVKLDVRANPEKRTGAKPNTAYTLFAEPRAKSDGAPTRGTVKATLSGEHMLNPRDKKVPADAKFDYQNPEKKDQSASIDFEARSKRGVGKATLQFDTKKKGYRVTGGGGDPVNQVVCAIDKPFVLNGKLFGVEFSGGLNGSYKFVRTPNIPGLSWKGTGSYSILFPNGEDKPGTMTTNGGGTVTAGSQSRTTQGGEQFTLTPVEDCGGSP